MNNPLFYVIFLKKGGVILSCSIIPNYHNFSIQLILYCSFVNHKFVYSLILATQNIYFSEPRLVIDKSDITFFHSSAYGVFIVT